MAPHPRRSRPGTVSRRRSGAPGGPLFDPVLVAHDGSRWAEAAAAWAALLAEPSGARVLLARVVRTARPNAPTGVDAWSREVRDVTVSLSRAAGAFANAELRVLDGDPGEALSREAEATDAGLVLLGARGRNPVADLLLGSTTVRLLLALPRPVLVAQGPPSEAPRILAAVEEGPKAVAVATAARLLADRLGGHLTLATVAPGESHSWFDPPRPTLPESELRAAAEAHKDYVFGPLRRLVGPGVHEELLFGDPAREIARYAEAVDRDLVVVGRRDRPTLEDEGEGVALRLATRGPFSTLVV